MRPSKRERGGGSVIGHVIKRIKKEKRGTGGIRRKGNGTINQKVDVQSQRPNRAICFLEVKTEQVRHTVTEPRSTRDRVHRSPGSRRKQVTPGNKEILGRRKRGKALKRLETRHSLPQDPKHDSLTTLKKEATEESRRGVRQS